MKRMTPEARVGLLVLSGLLILVYMSLKVGKLGFGREGGYLLYLELENAVGLIKEGEVLVAGIQVGLVEDIRLERQKALLVLRVQDKVKLPRDSKASLRTHGVLGEKYVEIIPGASREYLKDGDYLQTGAPPGDLDRLVSSLNEIAVDVKRVTERLANVLGTPEGEEHLREIVSGLHETVQGLREVVTENRVGLRDTVANLRALTGALRTMVDANRENVDQTLANAKQFTEMLAEKTPGVVTKLETLGDQLNGVVAENRDNLKQSLENLKEGTARLSGALDAAQTLFASAGDPKGTLGRLMHDDALYEDLRAAAAELKDVLGRLSQGEGTLGKLLTDDSVYTELSETLTNLQDVTQKIDQGEGTIGKLVNDESLHKNLNTTLEGINDFVTGANRFQFELGYRGEYLGKLGETKSYFGLEIRPRQDRFYSLALVDDPRGNEKTTTTETITDGKKSVEEKTETSDKLKFSAQVGKKFSNLTVRGGIIESSGGVGADLDFWADRFRLSFDAFDFSRKDNSPPHLKLAARWVFWDHFYLTGGLDDFIDTKGRSDYFVGGGIRFLDDDLKFLLSPAASLAK